MQRGHISYEGAELTAQDQTEVTSRLNVILCLCVVKPGTSDRCADVGTERAICAVNPNKNKSLLTTKPVNIG
jgi:hypothetical protein